MTLLIADVSEFQGQIDWATYGATNPVVVVRAAVTYWSKTQNKTIYRADYKWAQNRDGSRAHTQVRGFYQYLDATADPVAAARAFMAVVGPLQPGEFVVLDQEEGSGDQRARRQLWIDTVHGAAPTAVEWTYSGLLFARAHLPGVHVDWLAAYQGTEPTDAHTLWQYADNQSFAGIGHCDGSRFNGTLDQLKALVHAVSAPAAKPPVVATPPAPTPVVKPAPKPVAKPPASSIPGVFHKIISKVVAIVRGPAPVLRVGSTGPSVRALQAGLNHVFPAYSKLTVDGDFGNATDGVVKEFQRREWPHVPAMWDGVVGPTTRAALSRAGVTF